MRRRLLISGPFVRNSEAPVSGLLSTTAIGSVSIGPGSGVSVALSGLLSSAAVGSVSISIGRVISVSGVSSSLGVGSVTVSTPVDPAWDISYASFSQSFDFESQEPLGSGLYFKPDGTKFYLVGSSDNVNEYSLSTAWDVSTASFVQSFSHKSQQDGARGIYFKGDGTRFYIVGIVPDEMTEYSMSTAWDISTASFVRDFNFNPEGTFIRGLFMRSDGLKFYVSDTSGILEYNLSTAWDISTASFDQLNDDPISLVLTDGVYFKPDGTKLYIALSFNETMQEYDLSTPWDISTLSFSQTLSLGTDVRPYGVSFKTDGTKMYLVTANLSSGGERLVREYDLSV